MNNSQIAEIFREIAQILEIKSENLFRIRAYQRAAENIEGLTEDITALVKENRLREIPGIGKDLAAKIEELVLTGRSKAYEQLRKSIPDGFLELLNIPSLGPKTAKLFYEKLKIKNIADLEKAIKQNKLTTVFGIKEKTVKNLSRGIQLLKEGKERMSLARAIEICEEFIYALKKMPQVSRISPAGSLRRQKETVRDIDILIVSKNPAKVMEVFVKLGAVKEILAQGNTKSSVLTRDGIQVDLRVVEQKSLGAALLYFTGSKNFNIHLRKLAIKKNVKINEYGIFRNQKYICGKTEEDIFKFIGLSFIEPELREDTGEIEMALESKLPVLLEAGDIRGDLHVHSQWSDGMNSIEEMAQAAQQRGYGYIAITDHSIGLKVAGGLSIAQLRKKKEQIEKLNNKLKDFRVLYGTEVDIDAQGRLDYKDDVLKDFDLVVAAIHSGFKQSKQQITKRIISACKNKHVHIIAHLSGRLLGVRDAYELDLEEILKVAADTNTCLEINSFPQRMDLNDINSKRAKELKVRMAISTDAHSIDQLDYIKLGVAVARRGWLEKKDVINTLKLDKLLKELKK